MSLKFFFTFIFLLATVNLFATAQVPDYLIVEKDTLRIQSNPLEGYFKKHPIPANLITSMSSANWRGYIAYFKFLDGKLVVENIYKEEYKEDDKGNSRFFLTSIYKDIFGENKNFECSYYSGLLICPSGKILQYVHMGYSSLYENYDLIELKDGVKVKSKKLTAQEFMDYKTDYFRYYKKTEEYQQKAKEFKEMTADVDKKLDLSISGNSKKKKKENKYLKEKEAAYKADKEVESFLFMFLNDYMKTIEIPVN